ncbi:MAG: FAD-binding oxidoreductase [Pseudomonadota bacterium]
MKVSAFPCDPGVSGWEALLPPVPPLAALAEDKDADWLVIGAGVAGLAATRRLAQREPDARIVVLEARRVGEGPAGRNSGFMIDLPHDLASEGYSGAVNTDRAQTLANRAAIDFAADMAASYDLPPEAFARTGKVNAAATDKGHRHNLDYAAHLSRMDEPHEMLDASAMHELTGSTYYRSGLFTPGTAMVQPALFARSLSRSLVSNRVALHEDSPVTELRHSGVWEAVTPSGRVRAPRVILAVNGHAESFGQFAGRLLHVFLYASMTRALSREEVARLGGAPRWGLTPSDPMGTTVRRISGTGGDRIVIRNQMSYAPGLSLSEDRVTKMAKRHKRTFAARFPDLAQVEMEYRWAGRLCLSWNGAPALGEVEEGLFSACCQNGLGLARGTLHGMTMADLACGHSTDLVDYVLSQGEPSRLPPLPFTYVGASARMAWGQWSAGREL